MKKMLLLLSICILSIGKTNAQERFLRKASAALDERDFKSAEEMVIRYEAKEGQKPESKFMRFRILMATGKTIDDFDVAWGYLIKSVEEFGYAGFTEKEKKEWCSEILFCQTRFDEYRDSCDRRLYDAYTRENSIGDVSKFIEKYPKSLWLKDAKVLKSRLAFDQTRKTDTEEGYLLYIREYSEYPDAENARVLLWNAAYRNAVSKNTVTAYKQFLKDHPKSTQSIDAKKRIWSLEWDRVVSAGRRSDFSSFVSQYPDAEQVKEARSRIETFDWEDAKGTSTIESYEKFIADHPGSARMAEAKAFLDDLRMRKPYEDAIATAVDELSNMRLWHAEQALTPIDAMAPANIVLKKDSILSKVRYLKPLLRQTPGKYIFSNNGVEVIILFGVDDNDSTLYCSLKGFSRGVAINGIEAEGKYQFAESGGRIDIDWGKEEFNKSMSPVTIVLNQGNPVLKLSNGTVYRKLTNDFGSPIQSTVKAAASPQKSAPAPKSYINVCGTQYSKDKNLAALLPYGWEDRVGFYCLKNYREGASSVWVSGGTETGILIKAKGQITGDTYTILYTCDGDLY